MLVLCVIVGSGVVCDWLVWVYVVGVQVGVVDVLGGQVVGYVLCMMLGQVYVVLVVVGVVGVVDDFDGVLVVLFE